MSATALIPLEKKDRWQMFDAGVACQTFCLAAHEYGLGTVIMGVFDESGISSLLDIPKERELAALIALGYPDIEPSAPNAKLLKIYYNIDNQILLSNKI